MLKHVHFQGIKSLLDVKVDLEPFTVLVGPNGCGKSTVLDQIERLCRMSKPEGTTGHTFGPAGHAVDEWTRLGERTPGAPRTAWSGTTGDGKSIRMQVDWEPNKPWYSGAEHVVTVPGQEPVVLTPNAGAGQGFFELLYAEFAWRAQRLALSPRAIAEPSDVTLTELHADGFGLPTVLKDMAPEHTPEYLAMQKDLRAVVPAFRGIRLGKATRPSDLGMGDGDPLTTLDFEMIQGRFPAARISDGTRLALALLTVVHHPELPDIVLIDDIDHGLHLSAQFEMITAIRAVMKVRPELQVICTTHSPVLLDSFEISEVRVMALDKEGHTRIKPLKDHPEVDEWRRGLSAGELWANLGEDWVVDG